MGRKDPKNPKNSPDLAQSKSSLNFGKPKIARPIDHDFLSSFYLIVRSENVWEIQFFRAIPFCPAPPHACWRESARTSERLHTRTLDIRRSANAPSQFSPRELPIPPDRWENNMEKLSGRRNFLRKISAVDRARSGYFTGLRQRGCARGGKLCLWIGPKIKLFLRIDQKIKLFSKIGQKIELFL